MTMFASNAAASQSQINQRASYNSESQLGYTISGKWQTTPTLFATASLAYSRTPVDTVDRNDTFYQASGGAGYSGDVTTVDFAVQVSRSPLTEITSYGYTLGLSYIFCEDSGPEVITARPPNARKIMREKEPQKAPLFWTRFTYTGTALKSSLLQDASNSGSQTVSTIDVFFPAGRTTMLGVGMAFYAYDDPKNFFSGAIRGNQTFELNLLGATLQGLPALSANIDFSWQIGRKNVFMPRYQATELQSTASWSHTFDIGWQYQFNSKWSATPTYEASLQGTEVFTGFLLDVACLF